MASQRIAAIGECMVEVRDEGRGRSVRSFGGDTLNTAVYLARAVAGRGIAVDYVTALGDDPFSAEMLDAWKAEGIGTGLVPRLPGRLPGLYAIVVDDEGERSFHYWRNAAAARELFRTPDADRIAESLGACDWIYLSGISLSILDELSRRRLIDMLRSARWAGARIAVDANYRPRNWSSPEEARHWTAMLFRHADLALPSAEDMADLFDDGSADEAAERLHGLGVEEIVVKGGAEPCLLSWPGGRDSVPPPSIGKPVDTTAAGDSFNAGYIAARMLGRDPVTAARCGHRLASAVVMHRGAIIPREATPGLDAELSTPNSGGPGAQEA